MLSEYLRGALWVLPMASLICALVVGSLLSTVNFGTSSVLEPLMFQGTVNDARDLLIGIASTMITVIALVLGLTVVALQLSSTQYSPRLLRNFLRDRPNQVSLSAFVATFAYASAGLYTVGVSHGTRTVTFPRLAVTGALVLLFVSLIMLVYFVHHLSHSLQVDNIMQVVEQATHRALGRLADCNGSLSPDDVGHQVRSGRSGYIQAIYLTELSRSPAAGRVRFVVQPGDHVVASSVIALVHTPTREDDPELAHAVRDAVSVGFERTLEQDVAFGIRQLVDIASKALSPAVNDPYTAVQAVDHLTVLLCELAPRALGAVVAVGPSLRVEAPAPTFAEYLEQAVAQIRRYGASEPIVLLALLRLLREVRDAAPGAHKAQVRRHALLILQGGTAAISQPADREPVQQMVIEVAGADAVGPA